MKANEAFKNICALVAAKYNDNGWKYVKTDQRITKKDQNYVYSIRFYTSWNNVSDKYVAFYGECVILSRKTGGMIFNLNNYNCNVPKGKLKWNVAKEEYWESAVNEFTGWVDAVFIPIVENCTTNLKNYVKQVTVEGFYPPNGYIIDIGFVLESGSRELAEEAANRYYENLEEDVKILFKENYSSMINGKESVSIYGENMMKRYCNFRTIIENKISVNL